MEASGGSVGYLYLIRGTGMGRLVLEKVRRMRSVEVGVLIGNYSRAALGPVGDGVALPQGWRFGDGTWVKV
jgi:hypothetical protein